MDMDVIVTLYTHEFSTSLTVLGDMGYILNGYEQLSEILRHCKSSI